MANNVKIDTKASINESTKLDNNAIESDKLHAHDLTIINIIAVPLEAYPAIRTNFWLCNFLSIIFVIIKLYYYVYILSWV